MTDNMQITHKQAEMESALVLGVIRNQTIPSFEERNELLLSLLLRDGNDDMEKCSLGCRVSGSYLATLPSLYVDLKFEETISVMTLFYLRGLAPPPPRCPPPPHTLVSFPCLYDQTFNYRALSYSKLVFMITRSLF